MGIILFSEWADDDLTAQCVIFFLAGFDTVSVLMCFLSYELAVNQDVQDKLRSEIDEVREELDGKQVTYEHLQKMKYLDMCVSETLRKWPPATFLDRSCNKPTVLVNTDGNKIQLNKGDGVWFPVYSIHRDSNYYSDPSTFNPERFSDENKDTIKPFTYLPFGIGPRNCIGSRFALLEAKAVFFEIISELKLELTPRSQHPIQLKKDSFNMQAEKGFWIQYTKRTN